MSVSTEPGPGSPAMVEAWAPVRICDNGGWTDTWFGGPGKVLNLAVSPGVRVGIRARPGSDGVALDVGANERYSIVPGARRPARHRLLEAAVDAFPPDPGRAIEIEVRSGVPAGCGTGSSAAVTVALIGALSALRGERRTPREVAYAAHRLEVEALGGESGIQDQMSAALGGINFLEIDPYPEVKVTPLPTWPELDRLLTLVFLGRSHDSSGVHRQVIEQIRSRPSNSFSLLRDAAQSARDAVLARDLRRFGRALIANTEAQAALHPDLVGRETQRLIELAAAGGAIGWKVNGAGGSITILHPGEAQKSETEARLQAVVPGYRVLPVRLSSTGLRVSGSL